MFDRIRNFFFRKAFRRLLAASRRQRHTHTVESARSIGILFDATAEPDRREVQEYVQALVKKGKKVHLLGFLNTRKNAETYAFDFFTLQETTWLGKPKSEKAADFARQKFDLLLCLNREALPALVWLATESPSAMKIGFATEQANDFDMLLETPDHQGIRYFTEQLHLYLDKIVLSKHEPSRAL